VIWTSESGLVTIAGGKLTTYRSMAQELVDLVGERLKKEFRVVASRPCETVRTSLVEDGAVPSDGLAGRSTAASDFPNAVINHLIHAHGPEYYQVLELTKRDSRLAQPIVEGLPYLWAEVPYAIEQEMAMTASDILGRRTHILNEAWDNGLAAAPQVAAYIGEFLDWDKSRIDRELRAYQEQVDLASKFK
jgi:glycerol-3-phosphate dehydrogenase